MILPSYIGIPYNQYKDPQEANQDSMESSEGFFRGSNDSQKRPLSEVKRSGEVFKELRKAAAAEMVISREVEGNGGGNHVAKRGWYFPKKKVTL